MPSDTQKRFDVWLARVYFSDRPDIAKIRPVLVVDAEADMITIAKITSHSPRSAFEGEVSLTRWQDAGLLKPSTVRCSQVFKMMTSELLGEQPLGRIQHPDSETLLEVLAALGVLNEGS